MNLESINNIYIIGIEGAGTSALACILKAQGKNVIGSDEGDHFYHDVLQKADIDVFHKFDEKNLNNAFKNIKTPQNSHSLNFDPLYAGGGKIDLIIYSTAVQPETNPELKYAMEASKAGLIKQNEAERNEVLSPAFSERMDVLSYPQALGVVFNQAEMGIAVCGTHGKTTTTAMLATAMEKVGADPTALVGSKVLEWEGNTLVGQEKYFVIEADEYQNKLQYYNPKVVILTSADYDHPDFFKTEEEYLQVFKDFVARIPKDGFLVAYAGDKNVLEISKSAECEVVFYDELSVKSGVLEGPLCSDDNCHGKKAGCCPTIKEENKLVGMHNLLNATAVLRVIQKLGFDEIQAIKALREFQGTARRFEIKGEYNGAVIIDDYAHHPTEVKATLQAAKEKYPNKTIKCIFHPHTFTRTEALLDEFGDSFGDADEIYLLDIFGSAREKQGGVSSDDLIVKIEQHSDNKIIKNLHTIDEATKYFQENLTARDILITMGAGDVYLIADRLVK